MIFAMEISLIRQIAKLSARAICSCIILWAAFVSLVLAPLCQAENTYEIEEISLPVEMNPEISAIAFTPSGKLVAANRHGEVWLTEDPANGPWRRYAFGLHEPLGVLALSDTEILVTQRPELTRLIDSNGDGVADHYETVNDDWCVTDNWHEFTFGLRQDKKKNFVIATGLPDLAGPVNMLYPRVPLDESRVQREAKPSLGQYQGWVLTVSPDGKSTPFACGFRTASGVALSPDDEIFITDQQGDYIATSTLVHVKKGHFYGHPTSLKWRDDYKGPIKDLADLAVMRTPEAVALPHGALGGSPGEPVWDTTKGKFGPFAGQVFVGDFTKLICRIFLEKIDGEYQGVAFPFIRDAVGLEAILANSGADNLTIPAGKEGLKYFRDVPPRTGTPLRPGNMRMVFAPDGSLYVGQTTRGWGQGDGMQRIVWSGRNPVEMSTVQLMKDGFRINFTQAMDIDTLAKENTWRVRRFRYLYLAGGSPRTDETEGELSKIDVIDEGRAVALHIENLEPGYIYEIEPKNLASAKGDPLENPLAYYTLNRMLDGRKFTGPMSEPLIKEEKRSTEPDVESGRQLYAAFCAICHQADGRGGALPGTPAGEQGLAAANFHQTGPDSPLAKSDDQLVTIITDGPEGKPMPPFGGVLKPDQIRDVVAFLRSAFGENTPKTTDQKSDLSSD